MDATNTMQSVKNQHQEHVFVRLLYIYLALLCYSVFLKQLQKHLTRHRSTGGKITNSKGPDM